MYRIFLILLFFASTIRLNAQVKIHSHNDYTHSSPLTEAYAYQAAQVEADIFLIGDSLIVAHSKKDKNLSRTLDRLYLEPLASRFNNDKVRGVKTNYGLTLMIDVKESWSLVYPRLKRDIEKYGEIFNKDKNPDAFQIVISGARPDSTTFHQYPKWLFFDGLPHAKYSAENLERVTMISDNFATYSKWKGIGEIPKSDKKKLRKVVKSAHRLNKPMRFWGAPDNQACWDLLKGLGVDIINTDKVAEATRYFKN